MSKKLKIIYLIFLFSNVMANAQDVSLYQQFTGNVDFTMIGNTLNPTDNSINNTCTILTSSSATLNLDVNNQIETAYLYWSGSGTGDFDVLLNSQNITAERTFSQSVAGNPVFGAFTNVTTQVQNTGNGNYTLSALDLTNVISNYCNTQTNYGGWAIIIFYHNDNLPLNQINFYDGMQSVIPNQGINDLTINLESLFVIDNTDAKIGFLAWEGDEGLAVSESLHINGQLVSNPPLNPANNVFNGTNSFTNSSDLYNMDLDFYNIEDFINVGDTSVNIQLSSGQDFVMINAVAVKLNIELPDAIININTSDLVNCNNREISVNFDVSNLDDSAILPINTPISIYADNTLITTIFTTIPLVNTNFETFNQTINIPNNISNNFTLNIVVDDDGNGNSTVLESDESNNTDQIQIILPQIPTANPIEDLFLCDDGNNTTDGISSFDTSQIENTILGTQTNMEVFYFDAQNNALPSPLPNPFTTATQTVTVVVENPLNRDCNATTTITFNVEPLPSFNITNEVICIDSFPESKFVSILNPLAVYDYQWFDPNNNLIGSNSETLEVFEGGIYSVTATSQILTDCNTTQTFTITEAFVDFEQPTNILLCDEGFDQAIFNLEETYDQITTNPDLDITFFTTLEDLHLNENEITIPSQYTNATNPQTIFTRVENTTTNCYNFTSFSIEVYNCLPFPPNVFTPNNDDRNETFTIDGLRDIFPDFEIYIYNRYGNLIFKGNNNKPDWNGTYKGKELPVGTYFYNLYLHDELYTPINSWVYLNR